MKVVQWKEWQFSPSFLQFGFTFYGPHQNGPRGDIAVVLLTGTSGVMPSNEAPTTYKCSAEEVESWASEFKGTFGLVLNGVIVTLIKPHLTWQTLCEYVGRDHCGYCILLASCGYGIMLIWRRPIKWYEHRLRMINGKCEKVRTDRCQWITKNTITAQLFVGRWSKTFLRVNSGIKLFKPRRMITTSGHSMLEECRGRRWEGFLVLMITSKRGTRRRRWFRCTRCET